MNWTVIVRKYGFFFEDSFNIDLNLKAILYLLKDFF